jgi:PTS system galactitol-specific IIA component
MGSGFDDTTIEGLAICEENILVNVDASSREEVISLLGSLLTTNGFVKDTYTQAVQDREIIFPTGLQTSTLGVAIPHTNPEHVNRSTVAIATLIRPVLFQAMGNPGESINVEVVMMLAIDQPQKVVEVLRKVIFILEDEEALNGLSRASNKCEVKEILCDHIRKIAAKISTESSPASH